MRTTPEITLQISLDRSTDDPLPSLLAAELRRLIGVGVLAPGDPLPSSRALASHLGLARGSVVAAYDQLLAEGYLSAAAGRSTEVNPLLARVHPQPSPKPRPGATTQQPAVLDLSPGRPWQERVVTPAWKSAWRRGAEGPVEEVMPPLGLLSLRTALVDHLRRMRAVVREPEQVAIASGAREGLALLLLGLGRTASGRRLRVGVEEPGYPSLRRVPGRLGAEVVPLRADERGLLISALPSESAPDVVIVTPSHQYPLGGSLPISRRQALLSWARRHRVVIVEDDYDSELRYTSQPLPALAALDDPADGRVVLLGTLSKTLTPALAMGFLAPPTWLLPAITDVRLDLGQPVNLITQRAVAELLESGALRLHTQRMRNLYRRRRAQVVSAFDGLDGVRVYPMDGGLHAVVETDLPEDELVASLARSGVAVSGLSRYWSAGGSRTGLVFGFGGVSEEELGRGLTLIAHHLRAAGSGTPDA